MSLKIWVGDFLKARFCWSEWELAYDLKKAHVISLDCYGAVGNLGQLTAVVLG